MAASETISPVTFWKVRLGSEPGFYERCTVKRLREVLLHSNPELDENEIIMNGARIPREKDARTLVEIGMSPDSVVYVQYKHPKPPPDVEAVTTEDGEEGVEAAVEDRVAQLAGAVVVPIPREMDDSTLAEESGDGSILAGRAAGALLSRRAEDETDVTDSRVRDVVESPEVEAILRGNIPPSILFAWASAVLGRHIDSVTKFREGDFETLVRAVVGHTAIVPVEEQKPFVAPTPTKPKSPPPSTEKSPPPGSSTTEIEGKEDDEAGGEEEEDAAGGGGRGRRGVRPHVFARTFSWLGGRRGRGAAEAPPPQPPAAVKETPPKPAPKPAPVASGGAGSGAVVKAAGAITATLSEEEERVQGLLNVALENNVRLLGIVPKRVRVSTNESRMDFLQRLLLVDVAEAEAEESRRTGVKRESVLSDPPYRALWRYLRRQWRSALRDLDSILEDDCVKPDIPVHTALDTALWEDGWALTWLFLAGEAASRIRHSHQDKEAAARVASRSSSGSFEIAVAMAASAKSALERSIGALERLQAQSVVLGLDGPSVAHTAAILARETRTSPSTQQLVEKLLGILVILFVAPLHRQRGHPEVDSASKIEAARFHAGEAARERMRQARARRRTPQKSRPKGSSATLDTSTISIEPLPQPPNAAILEQVAAITSTHSHPPTPPTSPPQPVKLERSESLSSTSREWMGESPTHHHSPTKESKPPASPVSSKHDGSGDIARSWLISPDDVEREQSIAVLTDPSISSSHNYLPASLAEEDEEGDGGGGDVEGGYDGEVVMERWGGEGETEVEDVAEENEERVAEYYLKECERRGDYEPLSPLPKKKRRNIGACRLPRWQFLESHALMLWTPQARRAYRAANSSTATSMATLTDLDLLTLQVIFLDSIISPTAADVAVVGTQHRLHSREFSRMVQEWISYIPPSNSHFRKLHPGEIDTIFSNALKEQRRVALERSRRREEEKERAMEQKSTAAIKQMLVELGRPVPEEPTHTPTKSSSRRLSAIAPSPATLLFTSPPSTSSTPHATSSSPPASSSTSRSLSFSGFVWAVMEVACAMAGAKLETRERPTLAAATIIGVGRLPSQSSLSESMSPLEIADATRTIFLECITRYCAVHFRLPQLVLPPDDREEEQHITWLDTDVDRNPDEPPPIPPLFPHTQLLTDPAIQATFRIPVNRAYVAKAFSWAIEASGIAVGTSVQLVEREALAGSTRCFAPWEGVRRVFQRAGVAPLLVPFTQLRTMYMDALATEHALTHAAVPSDEALEEDGGGEGDGERHPHSHHLYPPHPLAPTSQPVAHKGTGLSFWSFELILALVARRSGATKGPEGAAHGIQSLLGFMDIRSGK